MVAVCICTTRLLSDLQQLRQIHDVIGVMCTPPLAPAAPLRLGMLQLEKLLCQASVFVNVVQRNPFQATRCRGEASLLSLLLSPRGLALFLLEKEGPPSSQGITLLRQDAFDD